MKKDGDTRFEDALPPEEGPPPTFEQIVDDAPPPYLPTAPRNGLIDSVSQAAGGVADLKKARRRKAATEEPSRADRLPPHAPEAEQGVLGCILLSPNECLGECIQKLQDAEVFYDLRHQTIYKELVLMYDQREAIDIITLQQRLSDKQQLDLIGGIPYLNGLQDGVPSAANLSYYLDYLVEKYQLRKMISVCTDVIGSVYDYAGDADELMDKCEAQILGIRTKISTASSGMKELAPLALANIETMFNGRGELTGIATGFTDFDKMTSGLQPGEMYVIAARPSMGKTSLAMNIVEYAAIRNKIPCGVFSMEMTKVALTTRLISSMARVNLRNLREGFVSDVEFPRIRRAYESLYASPIQIDDTPSLPIMQLRARARLMLQLFGIKLFVVDYLQLGQSTTKRAKENRQQEVSEISSGIKSLAKELNVPVIVLSQLNRNIEHQKRKPNLSDLRESGAIEQDADLVGLLYKPSYDDDEATEVEEPDGISVNLNIAKQRNGPTGDVNLTFLKPYTRFESAAKVSDDDVPADSAQREFSQQT